MTKIDPSVEVVRVIYVSTNRARHQLFGGSRVLGRPQSYGYRKPGDVFDVIVNDVLAQPNLFNAYPCNEPFIIQGQKVVDPCEGEIPEDERPPIEQLPKVKKAKPVKEVEPEKAPHYGEAKEEMVLGLPGIGKKSAEKLNAVDVFTVNDLKEASDEQLSVLTAPSRSRVKEWLESQE